MLLRPSNSLEAFNLAVILFQSAKDTTSPVLDLQKTVQFLSELLLEYNPSEVSSMALTLPQRRPEDPVPSQNLAHPGVIDLAAYGLVNLLHSILCGDEEDDAISEMIPSE